MASIFGVTITEMEKHTGNDNSKLSQGTVCLNGKELGFWSQEEHGGPNIYRFDPFRLREPAQKYYDQLPAPEKKVYGMLYCQNGKICIDFCDVLLADLVIQMDLEKEYMNYLQDGPCTLVTFQHEKSAMEKAAQPYSVPPVKRVFFPATQMEKNEIEQRIIQSGMDDSPHIVRIYHCQEDFVIGDKEVKKKRSKTHSR